MYQSGKEIRNWATMCIRYLRGYFTSAKSRRTTASLPSKLEADYFRSRYSNDGCGVQAPVHVASTSSLSENAFDLFLQPNDWLGKIDLKDAYFVIPIWRDHRKYLRFVWRQTLLEFACLPFGLAVAPPPPCIYEDHETSSIATTPDRDSTDNLFGRHTPHECVRDRSPARHAYSSILIREPRFCDQPREILFSTNPAVRISRVSSEHSGYDSAPAGLQSEFNQDALFNSTISTRCFSTGTISRLIGKLTASIQAVFPAPLHYRNLQQLKHQALSGQELRFPDTTLNRSHRRTSMVASTS